jgi:putative transposase
LPHPDAPGAYVLCSAESKRLFFVPACPAVIAARKRQARTDHGRPLVPPLSEGQMSDHKGARWLFHALPPAKHLIADRGYDNDTFRTALAARGTTPCMPPPKNRKFSHADDATLYRRRHRQRIENMFGRLKDWRRIAMRSDLCAHTFFSAIAIAIAATVLFWILSES